MPLALAHLPALLAHSPDACIRLLTLGLALIYLELNRPGSILPGATGLLAVLLSIAGLAHFRLDPIGICLLLAGFLLLLIGLLRTIGPTAAVLDAVLLIFGFQDLVTGPGNLHVQRLTAIFCGLLIACGTSILTRIARRARTNKGLD